MCALVTGFQTLALPISPILARCWPRGTTSDVSSGAVLVAQRSRAGMPAPAPPAMVMANAREIMVSARKVVEEQLGDLKLYRVPEPTQVASRQSKQETGQASCRERGGQEG